MIPSPVLSLVKVYNQWFSHIIFDTLPKLAFVCPFLMQHTRVLVLVMSQLQHENIVRFLGASMTPPHLCFVMELCDASLFAMLHEQRAAFTTYERVQVACDVAAAMHYLHTREVSGRA